jgi:murein DD-endopeptidase MepM/ murein hydrolase activator NlpD
VRRDEPIATVAGSHLHFEIRKGKHKYGEPMVPDFGS